jgi:L-arabinonolactonase
MQAELVVDGRSQHGEGVVWSAEHRRLYWTDIEGRAVHTLDPASGAKTTHPTGDRLCCLAPRAGRSWSEIVAAFDSGFAFFDLLSGERQPIAAFEPELLTTRLNDGRTDRQGRLVAGGMDEVDGKPVSSVVRLDPDLSVTPLFGGVACANGTCFSPDGRTLYFADSPTRGSDAFDYDPATGAVANRRRIATLEGPGVPDGACVDAEGFVWTAIWEGHRLERRGPDGRLDRTIEVPVSKPTCCAFGGADLDTLFITSSRLGESAEALEREPMAGGLFAARPGVRGLADSPFAG